jgi:hypothetical protein
MKIALTKFLAQLGNKPEDEKACKIAFAALAKDAARENVDLHAGFDRLQAEIRKHHTGQITEARLRALNTLCSEAKHLIDLHDDFLVVARNAAPAKAAADK